MRRRKPSTAVKPLKPKRAVQAKPTAPTKPDTKLKPVKTVAEPPKNRRKLFE